jgi:CheY-like chemotaxis protein
VASTETFSVTVLIIEDEETLRRAVAKLLRAKGLRVLEAADGRAAVELSRTHASDIDVALLDVTLPGLSGREVLRELRHVLPPERVIITSAYGREQAAATVNADLCQPYIRKPYRLDELLELVRQTGKKETRCSAVKGGI